MRTSHLVYAGILVLASQLGACLPGCRACALGGANYTPVPSFGEPGRPTSFTLPQAAGNAAWSGAPELAAVSANGSTDIGLGGQAVCKITGQPLGVTTGATLYFPEVGSAYGAWVGYHYNVDRDGPLDFFGTGAALWSHYGYSSDDYVIPEGEFGFNGLGGGAAFQQGFDGSGNAFGLRLGGGAALNRDQSRFAPYGEVGYDVFLLGDDFDNEVRFAAGVRVGLGGA
ncbi:MAG: hypothetical protein R3E10_19715 [Gemmatimonadota bacterium]